MVAAINPQREMASHHDPAGHLYLTCVLAGARYLVPAAFVREVEEVGAITPVPATPSWLRGVMNLRGTILGVVDLAHFLGLIPVAGGGTEALICAPRSAGRDDDDFLLALAVDAVSTIRSLDDGELQPLPEQSSEASNPYVIGLYRVPGTSGGIENLLGVLDLERLLQAMSLDQFGADMMGGIGA